MAWIISIDALLWIAAIVLFFAGLGWYALICTILAVVLLLFLSPKSADVIADIIFWID